MRRSDKRRKAPTPEPVSRPGVLAAWRRWLPQALVIVLAGVWAFSPAWRGDWIWDDVQYLADNPLMQDSAGWWKAWVSLDPLYNYVPLTVFVEWLVTQAGGTQPQVLFHALTLSLHLANAVLVAVLLSQLGLRTAWIGGLLFAVDPIMVESVAWMSELKNTLSLAPLLLAMIFWLRAEKEESARDRWIALALFAVSLLAKNAGIMLPVVLLGYAWWKRGRITRGDLTAAAPFFAVSLIAAVIALAPTHDTADLRFAQANWTLAGALAAAGWTIFFLLGKCLLPLGLLPVYPGYYGIPISPLDLLPWAALILMGVLLWRARNGWGRPLLLGLGFFLVNLVPVLIFEVMRYTLMVWSMDHLAYLPALGIIGPAVAGLDWLEKRSTGMPRIVERTAVGAILLLFAWQTHAYAGWWSSESVFWRRMIVREPDSWLVHLKYAQSLINQNRLAEAVPELEGVIANNPGNIDARFNLAAIYKSQGRTGDARAQLEEAVKLNPRDPEGYIKIASMLLKDGRKAEALAEYNQALKVLPDAAPLHYNIGSLYLDEGQLPQAVDELAQAVKLAPEMAQAHENLGSALAQLHRVPEALEHFQAAVELRPNYIIARTNLARALAQTGRIDDAIMQFQLVLDYDPNNAQARQNLDALQQYKAQHPSPQ